MSYVVACKRCPVFDLPACLIANGFTSCCSNGNCRIPGLRSFGLVGFRGQVMPAILPDRKYTISAPDVVSEDFSGQVVILNLSDGRYFSLGGIASTVWNNLLAGQTPQAILDSIGQHRPELRDEANRFVDRLLELKLIHPQEGGEHASMAALSETWAGEPPRIDVFDDLAELIFADPIHDVDEQAGWPAPRPQSSDSGNGSIK